MFSIFMSIFFYSFSSLFDDGTKQHNFETNDNKFVFLRKESINKDSVVVVILDTFFNELHVLLYQNNEKKNSELKIIAKKSEIDPPRRKTQLLMMLCYVL